MSVFIWSQVLAGIGMGISITSAQIKNPKMMRVMYFIASLFRGTHYLLLGTPNTGAITYITGSRWLTSIFTHKKIVEFAFIAIIIIYGFWNLKSWIDLFPIVSGTLGTLAAFSNSDRYMRVYVIIAMVLWVIYNITVFTPIGIMSSAFFLISNMVGYERFYHHNHIHLHVTQPVLNMKKKK